MDKFQDTVLSKLDQQGQVLTRLDERMKGVVGKVGEHQKCLFDPGGLKETVTLLRERQGVWNKGLVILTGLAGALAVWAKFWKD